MIIDSHVHYNNNPYKKPLRYLSYDKNGYTLKGREWEQLLQKLPDVNIPCSIEPGISLQSCEEILQLRSEYSGRIFPAVIEKIAGAKGITSETVEQATAKIPSVCLVCP